jgi:uncharacterized protein YcbX
MRTGTVSELWRYPVKSLAGEKLASAVLSPRGIAGDRGWAVFDEIRGGITGGKRLPGLRLFRARYAAEPVPDRASPPVEIVFPDGNVVRTDAPDAAARLGERLGRPVSLRALGPVGTPTPARLTLAGEAPETVRELMGLVPGEPAPDMSAFPADRLQELRRGNFFDAHPIHLITTRTLETLARVAPGPDWDPRRFRANLLVATSTGGDYPELAWIGRKVRVGGAVLEIVTGCPRCVMVTQAADELPADPRVMRALVRETSHTAGVYASVVDAGEIREGDGVEVL